MTRKALPYIYSLSNAFITKIGKEPEPTWLRFFSPLSSKDIEERTDKYLNAYVYIRFIETNNAELLHSMNAVVMAKTIKQQGLPLDIKMVSKIKLLNGRISSTEDWRELKRNAAETMKRLMKTSPQKVEGRPYVKRKREATKPMSNGMIS